MTTPERGTHLTVPGVAVRHYAAVTLWDSHSRLAYGVRRRKVRRGDMASRERLRASRFTPSED